MTNDRPATARDPEVASLKQEFDDLREQHLDLRGTVEQLQAQRRGLVDALAERTGMSRRQVLSLTSAAGVGMAVGGAGAYSAIEPAAADPSTGDSDGDVGTPANRVDVFGEGVSSQSVNTGYSAKTYGGIQTAHDAIPTNGSGHANGYLQIEPEGFTETVTLSKTGLFTEARGGTQPYIEGSGDHTVEITAQDGSWRGGWIDQTDASGSFDAMRIAATEVQVYDLDIDAAPRYGYYTNNTRCESYGLQIKGGDTAGAYIDSSASLNRHHIILDQVPGDGIVIEANLGDYTLICRQVGGDGVTVNGTANTINLREFGTTGTAVVIAGSENVVTGRVDGDLTLTAASSNNRVAGVVNGTVTDSGTGNDTSDVI